MKLPPLAWLYRLLCLASLLLAQGAVAAVVIVDDAPLELDLSPFVEIHEDHRASAHIADIANSAIFAPALPQQLRPGYTSTAIWLRVQLANNSDQPLKRWLSLESPRLQQVTLFMSDVQNHWQRLDAGISQPFDIRAIASPNPVFPLVLAPHTQQRLYLRIASATSIAIAPSLSEPSVFRQRQYQQGLLDAAVLGSLALTAIFALLMFLILSERAFLLHALTILTYWLYEISFNGYGMMYLWPHATNWGTRSIGLLGGLSSMLLILFLRDRLSTRERLPRWDRILQLSLLILAIICVGGFFGDYRQWNEIGSVITTLMLAVMLWTTLLAWRYRMPKMRFYLSAFSIAMLGNVTRLLVIAGVIKGAPLLELMTPFTSLLGNLLLLAAVIYRIILVQKEQEATQQALLWVQTQFRLQLEQEVTQRTADLHSALAQVHTANQARSRLLAYISHDLRSPLSTIINSVRRLQHQSEAAMLNLRTTIERSAAQQLELIDDLIDFAKGELNQLELHGKPIYLHAWLADLIGHAELLANERHNQFHADLDERLPAIVETDPKRLRQVLFNLLSNAAKFTTAGHIGLRVEVSRLDADKVTLHFAVSDTGSGIANEATTKIFTPFERLNSEQSGSGLGLSVAQQIVRNMGGELMVESRLGEGSRFHFQLSIPIATESQIQHPMTSAHCVSTVGDGKTVLLVDDDDSHRHYLTEILLAADFDVVTAKNGLAALECITEQAIDIIIVDQWMPQMSGWELLQKLRECTTVHMPVILCSSMPASPPADFPKTLQFDGTLLKPVSTEQLMTVILADHAPTDTITPLPIGPEAPPVPRLPPAIRASLQQALALGCVTDIEEQAQQLARVDPAYSATALKLTEAVRMIDLDAVQALLDADARQ
jgi:signal transduction histidine kinase/CheY-like chemotaxis protein